MSSLMTAFVAGSASYESYRAVAERSHGLRVRSLDQFFKLLAGQLSKAFNALREARCRRRLASDFRQMDGHLLSDIGINRAQAEAMVEGLVSTRAVERDRL